MTKRTRPTRKSGFRDPKIIIIASEGTETEKHYFDDLAHEYHNPKVKVKVVERTNTNSSPEYILDSLDEFCRALKVKETDEKWLVVDVDRWGPAKLALIAQMVFQKQIFLAVSNPCFEIWMLLHLVDLLNYPQDQIEELRQNRKDGTNRTRLEREIIYILGQYNKSNPDTTKFIPSVFDAIQRSTTLDTHPDDRWPNELGTRVYLLAQKIVNA